MIKEIDDQRSREESCRELLRQLTEDDFDQLVVIAADTRKKKLIVTGAGITSITEMIGLIEIGKLEVCRDMSLQTGKKDVLDANQILDNMSKR